MSERVKVDPNVRFVGRCWCFATVIISVAIVTIVIFANNPHLIFGVP